MCWYRKSSSSIVENLGNVSQKQNDNSLKTQNKVAEYCDLREFKIAVMKILNHLQENSEMKFDKLRIKMNE